MTAIKDREILRNLAGKYARIVSSEEMGNRRDIWRRTNDLIDRSVPFIIEDNGTFFKDLVPALECDGETERGFEAYLSRVICNYECIPDDRIFYPFFPIAWKIQRPAICPELTITRAADASGRELGYETNTPLAELESGLEKLQRGEFSVDREGTYQAVALAEDIFGDLLPVKIMTDAGTATGNGMAQKAVSLMGMENFYIAMMDQPENVHRFFEFVAAESMDFMNWLLQEKLFCLNNDAHWVGSGSIGYSKELPRRNVPEKGPWLPEDCWCFIEAQEAVGLPNDMFTEFIFPYMNRVAQHYGLVYYGCCEPVHEFWSTLKTIKNLRKITISPWCNQEIMADVVGKEVVLSRKPHPMQLCSEVFNPEGFTAHIKESLDMAKDNFIELIFRDTNPLHGGMKDRLGEACGIIKKLIDR
jgi:hypothetical protein